MTLYCPKRKLARFHRVNISVGSFVRTDLLHNFRDMLWQWRNIECICYAGIVFFKIGAICEKSHRQSRTSGNFDIRQATVLLPIILAIAPVYLRRNHILCRPSIAEEQRTIEMYQDALGRRCRVD